MEARIENERGEFEVRRIKSISIDGDTIVMVKKPAQEGNEPVTTEYRGELNKVVE